MDGWIRCSIEGKVVSMRGWGSGMSHLAVQEIDASPLHSEGAFLGVITHSLGGVQPFLCPALDDSFCSHYNTHKKRKKIQRDSVMYHLKKITH